MGAIVIATKTNPVETPRLEGKIGALEEGKAPAVVVGTTIRFRT